MSNTIIDRAYLAMQLALTTLREGCDCGCTSAAQVALIVAMQDLEGMTNLPKADCCNGDCHCR